MVRALKEAEDFGRSLTSELKEKEQRLREQLTRK